MSQTTVPPTTITDHTVAVFPNHDQAEAAIKSLSDSGYNMRNLSIIGQDYHTEERPVGFFNTEKRMWSWGKYGAFWGGLWGVLAGGVYVAMPAAAGVMVIGYLAAGVISAIEGAAIVGGLSALGAALYSVGIQKDSIVAYETAMDADGFLVMAKGSADDLARAKAALSSLNPSRIDAHDAALAAA